MVSSGIITLFVAVAVQAANAHYIAGDCGCALPPPPPPCPKYEEGCCPGAVIEKKYVVNKAVQVPYCYSVPTYSKKCYTKPAGVTKKVIPSATLEQKCSEHVTTVKVPTTDIEVQQQPLCKKTCTTTEYLIQIPIVETTCTSSPLCKKTVKTQENVLTTTARKTSCDKICCTSSKVIETPHTQTVCQDYQGSILKSGTKTIIKPEVKKTCVQLPPYRCLKPVDSAPVTYSAPAPAPISYSAPAPITYSAPAPAAVTYSAPAPADVTYSAPVPADVTYSAPAPAAVTYSSPAPADVTYSAPAPAPISYSAPAPATTCTCNCS